MNMTAGEIAAEYRQAKQPLKQIGILADLNCCSKREIVEILRSEGCELPKNYAPKRRGGGDGPLPCRRGRSITRSQGDGRSGSRRDGGDRGRTGSASDHDPARRCGGDPPTLRRGRRAGRGGGSHYFPIRYAGRSGARGRSGTTLRRNQQGG